MHRLYIFLAALGLSAAGCSYRFYAGDIEPLDEEGQLEGSSVADDGTVTFHQGRLEISLRPMTDEELNRQFATDSQAGAHSTNPYTFGNSTYFRSGKTPQRFTVFRLRVSNYEYPKVLVDGSKAFITTPNGRKYWNLTYDQLIVYLRRYQRGGFDTDLEGGIPGNEYGEWRERDTNLRRTLYPSLEVFSAQDMEGYLVFKPMDPDVARLTVHLPDVITRFDYKNDPVETVEVTMEFKRDIGHIYPDGRIEVSSN